MYGSYEAHYTTPVSLPLSDAHVLYFRCSWQVGAHDVCFCDYLLHTSYISDAVGAHDVCFTIHFRAAFLLHAAPVDPCSNGLIHVTRTLLLQQKVKNC